MIALSNNTLINEFVSGQSRDFVLEYTSDDDGHFAIVGAPQVPSYIDWKASSFAVSTQCRSLENNACDLGEDLSMQTFNCSKARSGIELSGRLTGYDIQRHHFDENKYLRPPPAFDGENFADVESVLKIARDVTDDEVDSVFSNPWRWLAVAAISVDPELLLESYKTDNRVWPRYKGGLDHMWLSCNSTGKCYPL